MAKTTDHEIEEDVSVIGEISVPDKSSLGWLPAEHVVVHLDDQELMSEFHTPHTASAEQASVIEFSASDIPIGSLLVDIDGENTDSFDLTELLDDSSADQKQVAISVPDEDDSSQSASMDATQSTETSEIAQISIDLAFPPLTIVVDDSSGTETVAL